MIETEMKKKMTVEEFLQLQEENIELLNGQMVREPAPTYWHQKISMKLSAHIFNQLSNNNKGEIIAAPVDVLLGTQVVQPDLLFILAGKSSINDEGKVTSAPDVVFEIISPSNSFNDTKVKFDIYEQFGVKEYFIVYPDDKTVVKYVFLQGKFHEQYREIGFVKSEVMGCEVNF